MDEKKVREAIEAFQGQVDWLKRIDDKGCEESRRCCIEYFETAIEALEKQIAKKPIEYEDKYYACPDCGNVLMCKWEKYPTILEDRKNGLPCCLSCLQAIDWSES